MSQSTPVPLAEAIRQTTCSRSIAHELVKKGFAVIDEVEVRRDPLARFEILPSQPFKLTTAQESAYHAICRSLQEKPGSANSPDVFLLHGVTGSGKTEVYLQSLAEAIRLGRRAIVLVPEIALTPQTIERFVSRFPNRVAVLHSQLSQGERFDEWHRIKRGEADVVIGPRSALFAPQPDLGLIIIDEEHEWTYKQSDMAPRYHARDAAVSLAELSGATVVLGSATPDVETYFQTNTGNYKLLQLPERIVHGEQAPMPRVSIIDLREELKAENRSLFSRSLHRAIEQVLERRQQAILFLNRRGAATSIQCRNCGHVLICRQCEVPLSYHFTEDKLVCHHCNRVTPVPKICPQCMSRRIKYLGVGTQGLEQEARATFPRARFLRWDSDVIRQSNSHWEILSKFREHKADILIGTQMVAKGLDLPDVTLVGVISADTVLNLPDFRAAERTFQLLSQVAGRAGRGAAGGQVIIQSYSPAHYSLQAASAHDYLSFYETELTYRRQLNHPPYSRLANLMYSHTNDALCQRGAEKMKQLIIEERDARGIGNLDIIGPAPAFMHRIRGKYRWQLIVRGSDLPIFLSYITFPNGWAIDIDPVGL